MPAGVCARKTGNFCEEHIRKKNIGHCLSSLGHHKSAAAVEFASIATSHMYIVDELDYIIEWVPHKGKP